MIISSSWNTIFFNSTCLQLIIFLPSISIFDKEVHMSRNTPTRHRVHWKHQGEISPFQLTKLERGLLFDKRRTSNDWRNFRDQMEEDERRLLVGCDKDQYSGWLGSGFLFWEAIFEKRGRESQKVTKLAKNTHTQKGKSAEETGRGSVSLNAHGILFQVDWRWVWNYSICNTLQHGGRCTPGMIKNTHMFFFLHLPPHSSAFREFSFLFSDEYHI